MPETTTVDEDLQNFDSDEIEPESSWTVFLRYPILYENAVQDSDTNGLGALSDTYTCQVVRTANQFPTLQLTYKRDGVHATELQEGRIIMEDMGPDLLHQKFRITQVQKSQDNIVVNATHIAGDIAYNTITQDIQIPSASADDVFNSIVNNLADPAADIRFDTDVTKMANVNMQMSSGNAGNLLITADQMGDEPTQSMVGLFNGEWVFDDFHYYFKQKAGRDTGLTIKYGRNLKTITQDTNVENTYTAGYFYAKYQPSPPKATVENEDWNTIGSTDVTGIGTAIYAAGGNVDIYDAPVTGHHVIGQVHLGDQLTIGAKVTDGQTLPDKKVVNTVNGDDWYYIENVGGWIDSRWITFDKSYDYIVTNSVGHSTVSISGSSEKETKYPFDGVGVVDTVGPYIRGFTSPWIGKDHHPNGKNTYPTGSKIHFIYKAKNQQGDIWYCVSYHNWVYGPHISFKKDGCYQTAPTKGKGYIKSGSQKYYMKDGKAVKAPDKTKRVSTRTKKTKHYIKKKYHKKINGKTVTLEKVVVNPAWKRTKKKKVKTTIKQGMYNLKYGEVEIDGILYYKTGNGRTLVKASDVDFKKDGTHKPQTVNQFANQEYTNGKVEMYSEPRLKDENGKGTAMNWSIPNGTSLMTGQTAENDGKNWTYVTYAGKSGWVLTDFLKNKGSEDFDPYNPDDAESSDDTQDSDSDNDTNVDEQEITVTLPEGTLYADSSYNDEVARVENVDLSSDFVHDYQDESGLDPTTGEYHMTQADIDELRNLAQGYMREYRFGYPNVSLTLTAEQISDIGLDSVNLYDYVTVQFDQLGISETAEVNSTTWDCMAHRYVSLTVGDIPPTYEHLMLDQAAKNADKNLATAKEETKGHSQFLVSRWARILTEKGTQRHNDEMALMEDLGLVSVKKDENGNVTSVKPIVSMQSFEEVMNETSETANSIKSELDSGGTSVIHASPSWINPAELWATTPYGKLIINNGGIGFEDHQGKVTGAISDKGMIYADQIDSGQITAAHIKTAFIEGALKAGPGEGHMNIYIGTNGTDSDFNCNLQPDHGGNAIWVDSANYQSMVSSGQIAIQQKSGSQEQIIIRPSGIKIGINDVITSGNLESYLNIPSGHSVVETGGQYTNLTQFIKAHFDKKYYHGL